STTSHTVSAYLLRKVFPEPLLLFRIAFDRCKCVRDSNPIRASFSPSPSSYLLPDLQHIPKRSIDSLLLAQPMDLLWFRRNACRYYLLLFPSSQYIPVLFFLRTLVPMVFHPYLFLQANQIV